MMELMEQQREQRIRLWFDMWLQARDLGMEEIFAPDCVYVESWGPRYVGRDKVAHWFQEWNTRGRVVRWDIRQFFHKGDQTIVEWSFRNEMNDGRVEEFDGLSLVQWDEVGRIAFLREFGCNTRNYDPYRDGDPPRFREESPVWF